MTLTKYFFHGLAAIGAAGLIASLSATAQPSPSGWMLQPAQSVLEVELTDHRKSGDVTTHVRATSVKGTIDAEGNIAIPLTLDQLDVVAELPRMLTDKVAHETQHIQGKIAADKIAALKPGQSTLVEVSLWPAGHEHDPSQRATTQLRITHLNNGAIGIATPTPIDADLSPLLNQDNAPLILSLLGYQKLAAQAHITFNGVLRTP